MMLLKKTVYHKLVAKVKNVDISGFVLKSKYGTDKSNLKKKISDADKKFLILVDLLKKTDYNAAATELENKIASISGSDTSSALNAIENEIANVSNLVKKKKKADYDTKISEIETKLTDHNHDKYITTPEFNNFTAEIFATRLAQSDLLNEMINSNKTKHLLVENKF